jgi:mevalonate kinase
VNQNVLRTLGVSCDAIDRIVSIVSSFGLAAKLTGGGGGGCVYCVNANSFERKDELIVALEKEGFTCQWIQIGGEGLLFSFCICLINN